MIPPELKSSRLDGAGEEEELGKDDVGWNYAARKALGRCIRFAGLGLRLDFKT
jgi:hypothetical protein